MFTLRMSDGGSGLTLDMVQSGFAIYLDNFAVSLLANDADLGPRFLQALAPRGNLLFSGINAAEISTHDSVRDFLNRLGAHWALVEWDHARLLSAETEAPNDLSRQLDTDLARAFFLVRLSEADAATIVNVSAENIFQLGAFVDWRRRDPLVGRKSDEQLDTALLGGVANLRKTIKSAKQLDARFPAIAFRGDNRISYLERLMIRDLVNERGFNLKKNDGRDFLHALVGTAFASAVVLDTDWHRRMTRLQLAAGFARLYGPNEVGRMVSELEALPARPDPSRLGVT